MVKESGLKETADNRARNEKSTAKIFTKSGYPKTFAVNIKVILNLLFHFIS